MHAVFRDDLISHLKQFSAAPFLFVGAGVGRRYLGLDSWEGLLRRFAPAAGGSYDFYFASANGDPAKIASLIAGDVHDKWWKADEYADSRKQYAGKLKTEQSALKAEVARYVYEKAVEGLIDGEPYDTELDLLPHVVVDGMITTNYDPFLEDMFPGFRVFVGQDELLFSDPQGVGEIYKIHGSHEEPDSIVLTAEDYAVFEKRNPYLAAKLLTIFVEHPVIFIGYSLGDPNVTRILRSIASVLTNDRIGQLQDRLIFIDWDPKTTDEPVLAWSPFVTDGYNIPMRTAKVADYRAVFEALGAAERRFSARLLRQLKERVYELVRTSDPVGALKVVDIDAETRTDEIDVVFGVGAVEQFNSLGLVGVGRKNLLDDVLTDSGGYPAARLVDEALPGILRRRGSAPVFKYLRAAGLLNDDGTLKDGALVDSRVAARVRHATTAFQPPPSMRTRAAATAKAAGDFATLATTNEPEAVLMSVALLSDDGHDAEALRKYLIEHRQDQFERGVQPYATQWGKAVCLYDWLKYGRTE
jgi:SIR2-like domain